MKISDDIPARIPTGLHVRPFGLDLFCDLKRFKEFLTLRYRIRNTTRDKALGFIKDVLADLENADVPHAGAVSITLTPAEKGWTAHMDVPIGD